MKKKRLRRICCCLSFMTVHKQLDFLVQLRNKNRLRRKSCCLNVIFHKNMIFCTFKKEKHACGGDVVASSLTFHKIKFVFLYT